MSGEGENVSGVLQVEADGVRLRVKVVPGASRDRVAGLLGDRLKVQLSAPAEGGKANRALSRLLAKRLGVPARAVEVVTGAAQPEKTLHIEGVDVEQVRRKLGVA